MRSGRMSRHRALGLTDFEYERIEALLGRAPNEVELAVFSLMWSEHCAYKHSRKLLRTLPTEGPRVVMGPGENAGAVAVAPGLACAFKVESHNHPSAVEPFQGAATGVGGILRDIFAVGARPVAILDSLRFGEPASPRSRYLLEHAVAGIGHYGNSIGVATVGGEIYFEGPYEQNCLVNAMCVGLVEPERLIRSAAAGVGNVVVLFGARTGRDGIGGASVLASAELGEADAAKRPDGPDRRPVRGEEAARVLARAARPRAARRAAGPRRRRADVVLVGDGGQGRRGARSRPRPGAAARGRPRAVRDHDLGVPGAHARRGRPGAGGRRARGLRALGGARDGDRHGDRHAAAARLRGREARGRHPGGGARRRLPAVRPRAARAVRAAVSGAACGAERRAGVAGDAPAGPARLGQPRVAPLGVRAVRLPRRRRAPCAARSRPTPPCSCCPTARRSRSRSTATAAASRSTRTAARSRRCSSARPTSPASGPSRSG